MIEYKPFEERSIDTQYQDLLQKIRNEGKDKVPIHARLDENKGTGHQNSREITGAMLQFDLSNGFPVFTERSFEKSFKGALGEVIGFLNGAETLDELMSFGMPKVWWESWVSKEKCEKFGLKEGHLGKGSYGASLAKFVSDKSEPFNQVKAVMKNMKSMPFLRTHIMTTWNPPYSLGDPDQGYPREVVVAPCHGNWIQFVLFDHLKELEMVQYQRSADVPVGMPLNVIEWASVGLMASHILGYKFTKYTHFLGNPHYYDVQNEAVDELLKREPRPFPTVKIETEREINDLSDFRVEDFKLEDYNPHPWFKIETPI